MQNKDNQTYRNYEPTEDFMNKAWADMHQQLDEVMPEKKERKPFIWWWLGAVAVLVVLLWGVSKWQTDNNNRIVFDSNPPKKQLHQSKASKIIAETRTIHSQIIPTTAETSSKYIEKDKLDTSSSIGSMDVAKANNEQIDTVATNQPSVTEVNIPVEEILFLDSTVTKYSTTQLAEGDSILIPDDITPLLPKIQWKEIMPTVSATKSIDRILAEQNPKIKFQLGLLAGLENSQTNLPYTYNVGVLGQLKKRKWSFSIGGLYQQGATYQLTNLSDDSGVLRTADAPVAEDTDTTMDDILTETMEDTESTFDNGNAFQEDSITLNTTHTLQNRFIILPLTVGYQWHPKWSMDIQIAHYISLAKKMETNTTEGNSPKWGLGTGVNYHINNNWQIRMGYQRLLQIDKPWQQNRYQLQLKKMF